MRRGCLQERDREGEGSHRDRETDRKGSLYPDPEQERVPASKRILHGGGSCDHGHTRCFMSRTGFDMWVEKSDRSLARIMKQRKRRRNKETESERSGPDFVTADTQLEAGAPSPWEQSCEEKKKKDREKWIVRCFMLECVI